MYPNRDTIQQLYPLCSNGLIINDLHIFSGYYIEIETSPLGHLHLLYSVHALIKMMNFLGSIFFFFRTVQYFT